MKHFIAVSIKLGLASIVLFSILPIFSALNIGKIFFITVLVTGVSYMIGDLFILPASGNAIATIADFVLFTATISFLCFNLVGANFYVLMASVFAATFISFCEAFFHVFMEENILAKTNKQENREFTIDANRFQPEFSKEIAIRPDRKKEKEK